LVTDAKVRTKKPRSQEPKKEYKEPTPAGQRKNTKNKNSKGLQISGDPLNFITWNLFVLLCISLAFILWILASWLLGSFVGGPL
jgi:hypothetical protein